MPKRDKPGEPLFESLFDYANNDRKQANTKQYPPVRESPPETFDPVVAGEIRDQAIQAAEDNANPEWREVFEDALIRTARKHQIFNPDHVWQEFRRMPIKPETGDPRACGGIFVRAIREGIIKPTGNFPNSVRSSCHRHPVREYESQIFEANNSCPESAPSDC